MLSNISFGSAYKVSSKNNGFERFWDFQDFAVKKEMQKGVQVAFSDSFTVKTKQYEAIYTMLAPDSMDSEIETFCANRGIQFKKIDTITILTISSTDLIDIYDGVELIYKKRKYKVYYSFTDNITFDVLLNNLLGGDFLW